MSFGSHSSEFEEVRFAAADGRALRYYVHRPEDASRINSALVYVHGLMSDRSWFKLPEALPQRTAVVYIQRQPKADCEGFMQWYEAYHACLSHFRRHSQVEHVHLVANCFGVLPALVWVTLNPESFTSLTITNPPIAKKKDYAPGQKLSIAWNTLRGERHYREIFLSASDYARLNTVQKTVSEADDTTYAFSDRLLIEIQKLSWWLERNFNGVPVPTFEIWSTEDAIVDPAPDRPRRGFWQRLVPDRVERFHSDHFLELLPQRTELWRRVFEFQRASTPRAKALSVQTVLVTGATGFLGRHAVQTLCDAGYRVRALARDEAKARAVLHGAGALCEVRAGTLGDCGSLERACEGADAIVHCAGLVSDWASIDRCREVNVNGTKNLLMAAHAHGVQQFIQISSLGVFGDVDQHDISEDAQRRYCSDNYSNSKIEQEEFVRKYGIQNGLPYTIVRPGFIYGEGDLNFMPRLAGKLRQGSFKYVGSGENVINTVYVRNVVNVIARVVGRPDCCYRSYNLADKNQVTARRFVEDIADGLGVPRPTSHIKAPVALAVTSVLEGVYRALAVPRPPPITRKQVTFMLRDRQIDSTRAYALLGDDFWTYEQGIRRTLEQFRSEAQLSHASQQYAE